MEEEESGSLQKGDGVVAVVVPSSLKSFCSNNTTCKFVNCWRLVGMLPVKEFIFKNKLLRLESIPMVLGIDPVSWFPSSCSLI
jgi:hypothetical protein